MTLMLLQQFLTTAFLGLTATTTTILGTAAFLGLMAAFLGLTFLGLTVAFLGLTAATTTILGTATFLGLTAATILGMAAFLGLTMATILGFNSGNDNNFVLNDGFVLDSSVPGFGGGGWWSETVTSDFFFFFFPNWNFDSIGSEML